MKKLEKVILKCRVYHRFATGALGYVCAGDTSSLIDSSNKIVAYRGFFVYHKTWVAQFWKSYIGQVYFLELLNIVSRIFQSDGN